MAPVELSWEQVAAWRAHRHGLEERRPAGELLDVVSRLCGLHAQVMSSAQLTASARLEGLAPDAVATALWEDRTLVKTWAMRGTLHLLPAAEFGLWQTVIGTDDRHRKPSWQKAFGPSPEELDRLCGDIAAALDGRELLREELAAALAREAGDAELAEALRASWGAMLKPAAFRGALCFAPVEGQRVRFTNPATWLGPWESRDPDTALAEAARRYLATHGPATRADFARWLAKSPAVGGRILAGLADEVASVEVDGEPYLALAADVADLAAPGAGSARASGSRWRSSHSAGSPSRSAQPPRPRRSVWPPSSVGSSPSVGSERRGGPIT